MDCKYHSRNQQLCSLRQFSEEYHQAAFSEWENAYIPYSELQHQLAFLHQSYHYHHILFFNKNKQRTIYLPVDHIVREQLRAVVGYVHQRIDEGEQRAVRFIRWKLTSLLYYWSEVISITHQHHEKEQDEHLTYDQKPFLKKLIKTIYAETICLIQFIDLNLRIRTHFREVIKDYFTPFIRLTSVGQVPMTSVGQVPIEEASGLESNKTSGLSKDLSRESLNIEELQDGMKCLKRVEQQSQQLFDSPIYNSQDNEETVGDYVPIKEQKIISNRSYFLLGMYIGLGAVVVGVIFFLLLLDFLEMPYDYENINSMVYMFPMLRGTGLLILYMWGTAWNVYGYIKCKVNFQLILNYGNHYSTYLQIMKRAGFFTLVFCLMLLSYLVGLHMERRLQIQLPEEYVPFVVWTVCLGYFFWPSQQAFNPKGRVYFQSVLKNILLTPFVPISFMLTFATDQCTSFVTSLNDFAYTICFYSSDFRVSQVSDCLNSSSLKGILVGYMAALLPQLLRVIQIFRTARELGNTHAGSIERWNLFGNLGSVLVSTLSFLTAQLPILFVPYIVVSIISTLFSYYWDLKYDWGLLEPNSKYFLLRDRLLYGRPALYYSAIILNFIFRCSWTLTISPAVLLLIPQSTFLPFLTGWLQILRRCLWNFFTLQKEHINNCSRWALTKYDSEGLLMKIKGCFSHRKFLRGDSEQLIYYARGEHSSQYFRDTVCNSIPKLDLQDVQRLKYQFQSFTQKSLSGINGILHPSLTSNLQRIRKHYFEL